MDTEFTLREAFFEIWGGSFARCSAPGENCDEPAIRAHSVQNARCLDLLARDGHLIQFTLSFDKAAPRAVFREIGRNRATTFTGLCSPHDATLFAPIDTQPLDHSDPEQLFLLGYRAVLRELHATWEVGVKSQEVYERLVEAGRLPGDGPSPAGMYAVERLMVAYETHLYKVSLDKAYLERDFDFLRHDVLRITGRRPSLAAAAMFSLDGVVVDDDVARTSLTILPLSAGETVVVLSYTQRDAAAVRGALDRVLGAIGAHQRYELSRLLLNSCENFVVAPAFYDTWSQEKREAIAAYFSRTILKDDLSVEDELLHLFWEDA